MKRTRHALRLATCLLVLAASGPLFADPALGGSDDRRGYQRGDDRRGSYQSDDRRDEYGSRDRGSSRSRSGERTPAEASDRNRAERRPLGTSRDDYRGRSDNDRRIAATTGTAGDTIATATAATPGVPPTPCAATSAAGCCRRNPPTIAATGCAC